MYAKTIITLAIALGISGLTNTVQAQSTRVPSTNVGEYALSGDSLYGIDNRSANSDFNYFFMGDKSNPVTNRNIEENNAPNQGDNHIRFQKIEESLSQTNTPIFVQPASSFNGNDGAQLQLDLGK
jgi:hypothetical protein